MALLRNAEAPLNGNIKGRKFLQLTAKYKGQTGSRILKSISLLGFCFVQRAFILFITVKYASYSVHYSFTF